MQIRRGIKHGDGKVETSKGLRAVQIRKGIKRTFYVVFGDSRLRAVQIRRGINFWEGEWADGKFESSANS